MSLKDKMTALADAIRSKTGGTEALTLDQMAEDVAAIKLEKPEESLYVVPKYDLNYTYTPEEGKVFNSVEVQGVGTDLLEEWDENFKAENIAKGTQIFGKVGTYSDLKTCTITLNFSATDFIRFYCTILTDSGPQYFSYNRNSTADPTSVIIPNVNCNTFMLFYNPDRRNTITINGSAILQEDPIYDYGGFAGWQFLAIMSPSVGGENCTITIS